MTGESYFDIGAAVKERATLQAQLDALLQPLKDEMHRIMLGDVGNRIAELTGAIDQHCLERAAELRKLQGKDTGAVNFTAPGIKVTVTLPKVVKWDGAQLEALAAKMRACGDEPGQYLKITYGVDERRYKEWPENIQAAFLPARTVETGKPKIEIKEG